MDTFARVEMHGTVRFSRSTALGSSTFTAADCTKARNRYRPSQIRVLFIAESPPSSGGYFYFTKTIGKDHLFRETMKALRFWPEAQPMRRGLDKRRLLRRFCSDGFFLIDTCETPVDKLGTSARKVSIAKGATTLPKRVTELDPDRIVILKKTVYQAALDSLKAAGQEGKIFNTRPIPFPSHGNQSKYRTDLRRILQELS